ncbi:MAG: biotin--[acetyl-CoA-carboxylase] ligase, partial [Planctomycetota bacterium]
LRSTNSHALDWISRGRFSSDRIEIDVPLLPRLILAMKQPAGRGRHGKTWSASEGGITLSWSCEYSGHLLSIAAGLAVAETIERLVPPFRCGLKWPNDVWLAGGKVSGILIERCSSTLSATKNPYVIGIGVNLIGHPNLEECDNAPVAPTSIRHATGHELSIATFLDELIPCLNSWIDCSTKHPATLHAAYDERCQLKGYPVRASHATKDLEGTCLGISHDGGLKLQVGSAIKTLYAGEIQRIRRS